MKILFIGPLPEPVGGHSLACKVFLEDLVQDHKVEIVNLNKKSFKEGIDSFRRVIEVLQILRKVWQKKNDADAIYLTISESFAGNVKDLFIYLICFRHLSKFYIHLHGGSIKKLLWNQHAILSSLNKIFIRKVGGAIVSGQSHIDTFHNMIQREKIYVVPNFAQDYLFLTQEEISNKFLCTKPLRILFLSNFVEKKGFNELLDAYFALSSTIKKMIKIEFAGRFESKLQEQAFVKRIVEIEHIAYHGVVDDARKKWLFSQAHIFCLPTAFLEGQPISILEAYASGCVVLTTGQSGIRDVFKDGLNGFEVQERSAESIKTVLLKIVEKTDCLLPIAISNREIAGEKYRTSTYNLSLRKIIESQIAESPKRRPAG